MQALLSQLGASLSNVISTAILFGCILYFLSRPPERTKKIIKWAAVIVAASAMLLYGYGYYKTVNEPVSAALQATLSTCRIFLGGNNWGDIKRAFIVDDAKAFDGAYFLAAWFWLTHLAALVVTASAVIVSFAENLMKEIRLLVFRHKTVSVIYGLNESTLQFAEQLIKQTNDAVVFVDKTPDSSLTAAAHRMGALVRSDEDAVSGNVGFLKKIGLRPKKDKAHFYALRSSTTQNNQYAHNLIGAFRERNITPEQVSLTILSPGNDMEQPFLAKDGCTGFGSVISINEPTMVARTLINNHPPCKTIVFDETGLAKSDFHAMILGFGQIGQAVLKQLVMNSQFEGCHSHYAIFDPHYEDRSGQLFHECGAMLEAYDITFHDCDARSRKMYSYLKDNLRSINYIVICAGTDTTNFEIAEQLQHYLKQNNRKVPLLMCSHQGVFTDSAQDYIIPHSIYTPEILCTDRIDKMAMVVNHAYGEYKGDMEAKWRKLSHYERMSSRASADFCNAMLYSAGVTSEEAKKDWNPTGQLLENLARTEHLRWNAFHYAIGFRPMTDEEFRTRAEEYPEKSKTDKRYKIQRDMEALTHACMVSWNELDRVDKMMESATGEPSDFRKYDKDIFKSIGEQLRYADKVL